MGKNDRNLEQAFYDIGSRYDFIVIGETHQAEGNERLYQDRQFYEGLSRAGYTVLGVELPIEFQPAIDAYARGDYDYFGKENASQLTPEVLYPEFAGSNTDGRSYDYKDVAKQLAEQITLAQSHGMRVIAFDDKAYEDDRVLSVSEQQTGYIRHAMDQQGKSTTQLQDEIGLPHDVDPYGFVLVDEELRNHYLTPGQLDEFNNLTSHSAAENRLAKDAGWVNHLNGAMSGEKAVLVVGRSHAENQTSIDGIDELLGGDDRVATITLDSGGPVNNVFGNQFSSNSTDEPHAVLHTSNMTMSIGGKMDVPGMEAGDSVSLTAATSSVPASRPQPAVPSI